MGREPTDRETREELEGEGEPDATNDPSPDTLPLRDISRLFELVREHSIGEVRVRRSDLEITVKLANVSLEPTYDGPRTKAPPDPEPVRKPNLEVAEEPASEREDLHAIRSPLVGTFYRAPGPNQEPYISVGDKVEAGQTLCIVEAMKLMNEIPADVPGEVVELPIEDSASIQYDQPLVYIRPDVRQGV